MSSFDNVSNNIFQYYFGGTVVLPLTLGPIVDTIAYGEDISIGYALRISTFVQTMSVFVQQSDDSGFSSFTTLPPEQIINPLNDVSIGEMTPDLVPLPLWGILGNDRYIRLVLFDGVGNVFDTYLWITVRNKPAVNYENYN